MYTLYKFHFLNEISEINQLFDDILIIWPAPVLYKQKRLFWMQLIAINRLTALELYKCTNWFLNMYTGFKE